MDDELIQWMLITSFSMSGSLLTSGLLEGMWDTIYCTWDTSLKLGNYLVIPCLGLFDNHSQRISRELRVVHSSSNQFSLDFSSSR